MTSPKTQDRSTPIPYQPEDVVTHAVKTVLEVPKDEVEHHSRACLSIGANLKQSGQPISPPPISTDLPPSKYSIEDATPRAHTRQEVEAFGLERSPSRTSSSLHSLEGMFYYHGSHLVLLTILQKSPRRSNVRRMSSSQTLYMYQLTRSMHSRWHSMNAGLCAIL